MIEIEQHPISEGYLPLELKTLIVGTFPPRVEYLNKGHFFFYSSVRNQFWNRIENIYPNVRLKKTKNKCSDISFDQNKIDKQNFANEKKIGFLDAFSKIKRKNPDSTKDNEIIPQENIIRNGLLFNIIDGYHNFKRICCTYKLAYETIKCNLDPSRLIVKDCNLSANGVVLLYKHNNKNIEIYLLYPASRSRNKKEIKDYQYKTLIFE